MLIGLKVLVGSQSQASRPRTSGRSSSSNVARSQLATTDGVIAVDGRGTRHVHRERDLAEVVAGPEHALVAAMALFVTVSIPAKTT